MADGATLERKYPPGLHPNSRANLLPTFKPGTRNVGKKPTLKTKIRRFLNEEIGTYIFDGMPINREDRLLLQAIEDAESATLPIDRHRALNILLDRLYGKPAQRIKQSGTINHTVTGLSIADMTPEQWESAKELIRSKKARLNGDTLEPIEAEFIDEGSNDAIQEPEV